MLKPFPITSFSNLLYGVIGVITFLPCNKAHLVIIISGLLLLLLLVHLARDVPCHHFFYTTHLLRWKEQLVFDLIISG